MCCTDNPLYFFSYLTNYNSFITEHLYADERTNTSKRTASSRGLWTTQYAGRPCCPVQLLTKSPTHYPSINLLYAELNPMQVFSLHSKFSCSECYTSCSVRISAECHVYIIIKLISDIQHRRKFNWNLSQKRNSVLMTYIRF